MLHLQRVGVAESLTERSLLNGPLRARSKESNFLVFRDVRQALAVRNMLVFC